MLMDVGRGAFFVTDHFATLPRITLSEAHSRYASGEPEFLNP